MSMPNKSAAADIPRKVCFVTIGATASFASLIRTVLSPSFLTALEQQNYTDLLIQYGANGEALYAERMKHLQVSSFTSRLHIKGFDLDQRGLAQWMRLAKTGDGGSEGIVVSHAGSGTILDALRISVPLIVVPNAELLDNHQIELAEALAEQEYVVHGKLEDLPRSLVDAEKLRLRNTQWPPVNSGVHRQSRGLAGVLDEEMGFLD